MEADAPPFDRRLVVPGNPRDCWIVLSYRSGVLARPLRPVVRFERAGGTQDCVLPGVVHGLAHWLGYLPPDIETIRILAEPGFDLERVGLRNHASLLAECLAKRPLRVVPALFNRARGDERRFRDILRGACAVTPLTEYPAWRDARLRPSEPPIPPADATIRLILPASTGDGALLGGTIDSLLGQTHRAWRLLIAHRDEGAPGPAVPGDPRIATGRWDETVPLAALLAGCDALSLMRPGDQLRPDALALLAARLSHPDAPDLVYADEEQAGVTPRLKPDWSPDLALSTAYLGSPTLLARRLVDRLGDMPLGAADGLDFCLAAVASAGRAAHIPQVLCRSGSAPTWPFQTFAERLGRHLRAAGSHAHPKITDDVVDLAWRLPDPPPLVSIVIPTRDRFDLIDGATHDVLHGTDYAPVELVIVDNGSTDPKVLALYDRLRADQRVRILDFPQPFNFAAMVNAGVAAASGRVVVLLNNDIAVLRPDWLTELVAQACRPEVGAVGAKLLYGDGSLQHAGVVVGLGGRAGHVLRRRPADSPGHLGAMRVAHEVSAVTAACLAVERAKYGAVGGFDAETFPIDFNDVDFCLRLGAAGLKTIWTPKALLSHLESVSRGPSVGAARERFEREAKAFEERWRDVIRHDPFYHPALSLTTFGEDLE